MDYKEKTLKLWEYLAETGVLKVKAYHELGLEDDYSFCPLCQYAIDKTKSDVGFVKLNCIHCPMYNKWDNEDGTKSRTCNATNTYYRKWERGIPSKQNGGKRRKKYAKLLYENFKKDLK